MDKEYAAKILKKIDIIVDWYDEMTGGEFSTSNQKALELITKLEEVK